MRCVFCTEPPAAGEIVFEDELTWVMLHHDWAVRGHAMVVAKRHVQNASDLADREWLHMARVERMAERILLEETGCERAILLKLGIQTPHLHVHIYPVRDSLDRAAVMDVIDARVREPRDEDFVRRVRERLDTTRHHE